MSEEIKFDEIVVDETNEQFTAENPAQEPVEPPKKRGRGRPKGAKNKKTIEREQAAKQNSENGATGASGNPVGRQPNRQLDMVEEIKKLNSEYQKAPEAKKGVTDSNISSPPVQEQKVYISGTLLLIICDAAFPLAIGYLFGKNKDQRAAMKLSAQEKAELKEVAEEAAKEIMKNMSPLAQFALAMSATYISKM